MNLTLSEFVGAAGGGALGAALGGLLAFSLLGAVTIGAALVATAASSTLLASVAFGSVLGPHVMFAGGVAAAAYAAHRGLHPSGRDIAMPLIVYSHAPVLLVGAAFGVLGQLVARLIGAVPALSDSAGTPITITDPIAVSVLVTAILATAIWRRGAVDQPARQVWLPWQRDPTQALTLAATTGCATGAIYLAWPEESRGVVALFVYGISALSLLALVFDKPVPVTHHITLTAALAAGLVAEHVTSDGWILLAAVGGAVGAALLAEIWARTVLVRSPVHIDPPAFAIAAVASVLACARWGFF
ncbi:hypothetical protein HQO84_01500 [Rhodococcus fascians]|nr:hypothetical protein [Rhodococcus fascians]MBY3995233.1 hypothetical protein [Rhodococcus fascians]MBY4000447.1 hypothetical protein [Rhodococcus fascians]MBY4005475.1 hypothetical protein [Rhodococcus fascians]MBY4016308.1 hypothetical protein [Rhodococcus fascians]